MGTAEEGRGTRANAPRQHHFRITRATMSLRRYPGPALVWLIVLLPVALWILSDQPVLPGRRASAVAPYNALGQVAGLAGMAMLSVAFVLASRWQRLESLFGGLDKMYGLHHRLGITAFVLLLLHPLAHAFRYVPDDIPHALRFVLPLHQRTSMNLGAWAFLLFVALVLLTLYRRFPYDKWKISHRLLGLVLLLATIHMLWINSTPARPVAMRGSALLTVYMTTLAVLGLAAFLYKWVLLPLRTRRQVYEVSGARRMSDQVLEVSLAPVGQAIRFNPGQFVFVRYDHPNLSRESHPFTICSSPDESELVLTVKALGDYTRTLYQKLQTGTRARVDGPYGRFDFRSGSTQQIWLAGGVGIVPFLSWARWMRAQDERTIHAHLYYCVHSRSDAVHLEEFQDVARALPNLRVELVCSEERGRLQVDELGDVRDRDVYLCGPRGFSADLRKQLVEAGADPHRIHFEEFDFR